MVRRKGSEDDEAAQGPARAIIARALDQLFVAALGGTPGKADLAGGKGEVERTRFAWISVYEKQAGQWRLMAIASTERPDSL